MLSLCSKGKGEVSLATRKGCFAFKTEFCLLLMATDEAIGITTYGVFKGVM